MSEFADDLVDNLKEPSQWVRIFFMLVFYFVSLAVVMILLVLTLGQALFSLITGKANDDLCTLGGSMAQYNYQIWQFLTYNTETKPFPFDQFPGMDFSQSSAENKSHGATFKSSENSQVVAANDTQSVESDDAGVETSKKKKTTRRRKKNTSKSGGDDAGK